MATQSKGGRPRVGFVFVKKRTTAPHSWEPWRRRLGSNADPLTSVYAEPNENSDIVGQLEARTEAQISESTTLEVWFLVKGDNNGQTVEGWAPSRYIQIFEDEVSGRVDRGNSGEFTRKYVDKMVNDRFFWPALRYTAILLLLIIPTQFVLAMIMALVIQAQLKFNSFILYIFAIPLGVSDLAVGILWFAIFTQNGLLNSFLQTVGAIETRVPLAYGRFAQLDSRSDLASRSPGALPQSS